MKQYSILIILALLTLINCTSAKQAGKGNEISIIGRWELKDMPVSLLTPGKLYPARKPYLSFDTSKTRFSGNTGCNSLSGPMDINGKSIKFKEPIMMTKMACLDGMEGENLFLQTLKETNSYRIKDSILNFFKGDRLLMQFVKR